MGSWNLQTAFICSCVSLKLPKRPKPGAARPKSNSKIIQLQGRRVCKEFYLKTLDISNGRFISACAKKHESGVPQQDLRGKKECALKVPADKRD